MKHKDMNTNNKQLTVKERLESVRDIMKYDESNSRVFAADKVIKSYQEFINSQELFKVHEGFQSNTSIKEDQFIEAYIVGQDVYVLYKADGIKFVKKESISRSLDNGGLCRTICLPDGFLQLTDECYDKGEGNRKTWRRQDWIVLSSEHLS